VVSKDDNVKNLVEVPVSADLDVKEMLIVPEALVGTRIW
jgi:hypothetical protein